MLLRQMATRYYGKSLEGLVAAPPHTALRAFGGNLSLEDFRKGESQVCVETPPFVPQRRIVHDADGRKTGWSVFNLRRPPAEPPRVVEGGERGMYFDFVRQQEQREATEDGEPPATSHDAPTPPAAAPSEARRASRGALERFLK